MKIGSYIAYEPDSIRRRILGKAIELETQNNSLAKKGKLDSSIDSQIGKLMLISGSVEFWNTKQLKYIDAFLKDNYQI